MGVWGCWWGFGRGDPHPRPLSLCRGRGEALVESLAAVLGTPEAHPGGLVAGGSTISGGGDPHPRALSLWRGRGEALVESLAPFGKHADGGGRVVGGSDTMSVHGDEVRPWHRHHRDRSRG